MKSKLDIALEKLKENTCMVCGRLKLHAGCCTLVDVANSFIALGIATAAIPIALLGLQENPI